MARGSKRVGKCPAHADRGDVFSAIETDDPDGLRAALDRAPRGTPAPNPATFRPAGAKRGVLEWAARELHRAAPAPAALIPLPAVAAPPFGGLEVRVDDRSITRVRGLAP